MSNKIEYRTGDLFAQRDLDAIGHGVNCVGAMGAGVAVQFRNRWSDMYDHYRGLCRQHRLMPGMFMAWPIGSAETHMKYGPNLGWIYNLATQHSTGRDARLDAVGQSVSSALVHAEQHDVSSLGLPLIGCGIGGLQWPAVEAAIERASTGSAVRIIVVTLPGQRRTS